mmetsp:Transcript_14436/g.36259  ORF Transcript_14436/g.36259 Transcript_14436/m.36259 type:complete len:827 (-) Transcript_14436:200-2680(-)
MIMNLKMLNTIGCILLLAPWSVDGQNLRSSPEYRVRSPPKNRDLQAQFNPLDMILSYSDDGAEREDEFYLDIFDTPDILTNSQSPMVVSNAMNFFLLEELNSRFDELNAVEKVASEIVHLKTRNGTYVNATGFENSRIGTEARMKVILTFEQTPSPATEDVEIVLRWIMSDLSYFVTNLTSSVSDDNELKGVYVAIRREIRPILLVQPPENIIVGIAEKDGKGGNSGNSSKKMLFSTVPALVAVAILVAVVVFFVFKKRDKPREPESVKDSEMMYDVDNEVFSMDRSVQSAETRSPTSKIDQMRMPDELSSIQYSVSADSGLLTENHAGCDSIFSGIDTDLTSVLSPTSLSSPKSMLTGFTCASASTIRASNTEHNKRKKKKSPVGGNSVFAFLDPIEDADEESDDDIELNERVQSSKNQEANENAEDETESSSSSSLEGVSINLPVKSKEEEQAILADLENAERTIVAAPRDPTPSNMALRVETDATPRNNEAPNTDEKKQSGSNKASNFMTGFFKGKRKNESTSSPPPVSPNKKVTSTPPDSPMQQVGRHWINSSGKKTSRRVPMSPKPDVDYDMFLSQPSPTGSNDSREFNDSINDKMRIVDKAPQDLGAEYPGGRRHAGDKFGGDGTAFYQASAMKPTDWSVKSSDAGSVGSSAVESSPGQNQDKLNSQSQKSVSASRQLISDLVWLEKKISTVRGGTKLTRSTPPMESDDSVLYDSRTRQAELSSNYSSASEKDLSNIVCRDCFAPPGKLNIVIHSTKDGPAVHTVKDGSSLEGEIYPGDLIISVDNLDTRTCTAEEVMNMMASKGDQERKITVLRFLEEA